MRITGPQQVEQAARNIHRLGARYVLLKGGHMEGENAVDYLYDGQTIQTFSAPRIATRNTHGTGCTYSAAIAAYLARGCAIAEAVQRAKAYLTGAIQHSFPLGAGHGPLNHFWRTDA